MRADRFVSLCYAIAVVYWIIAAFWTKRTAERRGWWGTWPMRCGAIGAVGLMLMRTRTAASGVRHLWPRTPAVGIAAECITAAGLIVLLWARITLAGNWSADVVLKEDHELIQRGPYRYVRHPIYTGFLLMAAGGLLLWATAGAIVVAVLLPLGLWLKLSQEERLLTQHFPEAYPRYKARVKALVPFVI